MNGPNTPQPRNFMRSLLCGVPNLCFRFLAGLLVGSCALGAAVSGGGASCVPVHARGGLAKVDRTARLQTALSLGLWVLVIILGRWIAYE